MALRQNKEPGKDVKYLKEVNESSSDEESKTEKV
jgi:hypothetical protein